MVILGQRNPAWANVKLGSLGLLNIGGEGCTTTCLAMLNNKFGANCTPAQVADHLDWYTPEGLVMWNKLALQHAVFEIMGREYSYVPDRVRNSIKDPNKGVLLEVAIPRHGKHWLLADSINFFGRILAIDPWYQDMCDINKRYGAITGSAYFTKRII